MISVQIVANSAVGEVLEDVQKTFELAGIPRSGDWIEISDLGDVFMIDETTFYTNGEVEIRIKLQSSQEMRTLREKGWI